MSVISVSLPSDGTTADVSDYNTPITTIVNAINGNLDSTNIASLSGTKITAGTIPGSALDATTAAGYITGLAAPNTVTALGNRSYSMVFNSVNYSTTLSAGMRLRTQRTVAAPTQCTSLNGTTQFYSKTSPAGMTFTDDFVVSAWIKLSSYQAGSIASRYNGTSGWDFLVTTAGQLQITGFNAGAANFSFGLSYQSIPLNKWVHVAAQLDMSTFTASTTTTYMMIDGVDVPITIGRGGTNPTALVQAGNLEIGSRNGGTQLLAGKIAQVAIYNAKVTQATILASMHQTLAGTETSLISAYSFNNTINDLNANANNLTANGSAVATNADSPFGGQADSTISSTLDYAIIQKAVFSTNTTLTVQVPEGCTIPTSGGVSSMAYSGIKAPYGMSVQKEKWRIKTFFQPSAGSTPANSTWYQPSNIAITVPIGSFDVSYRVTARTNSSATSTFVTQFVTLSTTTSSETDIEYTTGSGSDQSSNGLMTLSVEHINSKELDLTTATPYYLLHKVTNQGTIGTSNGWFNVYGALIAENAYL